MNSTIKHVWWSVIVCAGVMNPVLCFFDRGNMVTFSFDQLYPTTAVSHTLNSLRVVWSLAQDLNDNQYEADQVRHAWLDLYGASAELARNCQAHQASQVMQEISHSKSLLKEDMREYIQTTWHMIGLVYDQIKFKDESLGQFLSHMRIACTQVIHVLN